MINFRLYTQVFSLEIRKIITYRVEFWVQFFGVIAASMAMSYFLWQSIFEIRQTDRMEGYTLHALMFYYLIAPLGIRMLRGSEMGFISREIYDGTINRFIVYPVSIFSFKGVGHLASVTLNCVQLLAAILLFILLFGLPEGYPITPLTLTMGLLTLLVSSFLYYVISTCIECFSFWADYVWSFIYMFRMITELLGGSLIPIEFFPSWSLPFIHAMPFYYLIAFPMEVIFGKVDAVTWLIGLGTMSLWFILFVFLSRFLWAKGSYRYTGVGI